MAIPWKKPAPIAIKTVMDYLKAHPDPDIELVRFVLFGREAYQSYEKALKNLIKRICKKRKNFPNWLCLSSDGRSFNMLTETIPKKSEMVLIHPSVAKPHHNTLLLKVFLHCRGNPLWLPILQAAPPRSGWADAARDARQRKEDRLLGSATSTCFDDEE